MLRWPAFVDLEPAGGWLTVEDEATLGNRLFQARFQAAFPVARRAALVMDCQDKHGFVSNEGENLSG